MYAILYSVKNWRALNLAISAKTLFFNLVDIKFGDSVHVYILWGVNFNVASF